MGKVKSIHENQYKISDNSARSLLDLGFKYDTEEDKYVYNFAVMKHEGITVLSGRITAYTATKKIQIDVTDNDYNIPWVPLNSIECGNYDVVLNRINKAILNELSKLKITKTNGKRDMANES